MINIAFCDDNKFHRDEIVRVISNYSIDNNIPIEYNSFESGESLLQNINFGIDKYQIIFLDIEMGGINGLQVASHIRKTDRNVLIIYITSYEKYTIESFKVSPFRYILKPIDDQLIEKVFLAAVDEINIHNQYLFFKFQNINYQIPYEEIIYLTLIQGRMIKVRTRDQEEEYRFYGKIKEMEDLLNPLVFIKINQGTILNLNYIHIISGLEVELLDGELLYISRGQKNFVKSSYNRYIKRKVGLGIF